MERRPNNPKCPLSDTRYCDLLNMGTCERCTIGGAGDTPEQVMADLDLYESLLPECGVAQLFLSRQCQFCKSEPKGEREGYAILDMAHPEPKRIQRKLFIKRVAPFGTMIPLQFSICRHCRRKLLLIEYLPILVPLALAMVGLGLLSIPAVNDALVLRANWLPFAIWAAMVALGVVVGRLASKSRQKSASRTMYADVLQHPVVREMLDKGWFPISRESRVKVVFSKSRRVRGLGTAIRSSGEETH